MRGFTEKIAALGPAAVERSVFKVPGVRAATLRRAPMKTAEHETGSSETVAHEDLLPSTTKGLKTKKAMIHPSAQEMSEKMTPAKWKQTFKDVPFSVLAGGVGYGIGRTIAEVVGSQIAQSGQRPGWAKHLPIATAVLSAGSAFAGSRVREGLKRRREAAE